MSKYGMRVFSKNCTTYVEGVDGTVVPIWKAIEERKIGLMRLGDKEINYLRASEEYYECRNASRSY